MRIYCQNHQDSHELGNEISKLYGLTVLYECKPFDSSKNLRIVVIYPRKKEERNIVEAFSRGWLKDGFNYSIGNYKRILDNELRNNLWVGKFIL